MTPDERKEYVKYRIESAYKTVDAAKVLAENGFWNSTVNRLYYAVFYAVNALLVMNNIQTKSHSATKSQFSLHFVRTGKFDKKYGKLLAKLYDWRQKGDYENIFDYNDNSVQPLFAPVKEMIQLIERDINNNKMKEFTSADDILDFAIDSEQQAVDFYTGLAKNAKTDDMREVFQQFAKEEIGHKTRLTSIKETKVFELSSEKVADLKIGDYLVPVQVTPDMTYQEVLILAMKREKAAFKLYNNLAAKSPTDELREVFLSLAQEEAKHKLRFEIEYDNYILTEN